MSDPLSESAKATQEVAKTTGKAIDATRSLGAFVAKFIGGPLEQASGIVEDKLKYLRWERQLRLIQRTEEFLREQGLEGPTRPVPIKVALPLFQAASVEEDDELQDMWAQLLANAANADSGIEIRRAFVSILADFGPLEARAMEKLYELGTSVPRRDWSIDELFTQMRLPDASPESLRIAVWNLLRLGCAKQQQDVLGAIASVSMTDLGYALIMACRAPDKEN